MCKQMQLTFQAKYKSTNYSAAQGSVRVRRFGAGCVFVPSQFLFWDKGRCFQKRKICFIVSCVKPLCAYFLLGFFCLSMRRRYWVHELISCISCRIIESLDVNHNPPQSLLL